MTFPLFFNRIHLSRSPFFRKIIFQVGKIESMYTFLFIFMISIAGSLLIALLHYLKRYNYPNLRAWKSDAIMNIITFNLILYGSKFILILILRWF